MFCEGRALGFLNLVMNFLASVIVVLCTWKPSFKSNSIPMENIWSGDVSTKLFEFLCLLTFGGEPDAATLCIGVFVFLISSQCILCKLANLRNYVV